MKDNGALSTVVHVNWALMTVAQKDWEGQPWELGPEL